MEEIQELILELVESGNDWAKYWTTVFTVIARPLVSTNEGRILLLFIWIMFSVPVSGVIIRTEENYGDLSLLFRLYLIVMAVKLTAVGGILVCLLLVGFVVLFPFVVVVIGAVSVVSLALNRYG